MKIESYNYLDFFCWDQVFKGNLVQKWMPLCFKGGLFHLDINKGLVTNYREGGRKNGMEGQVKFYPCEKGGGGGVDKVLARLKGGSTKSFGVVSAR